MDKIIFDSTKFGSSEINAISLASSQIRILKSPYRGLLKEEKALRLEGATLQQSLDLIARWSLVALASVSDIYRNPPPDINYLGFGLSCHQSIDSITLMPYVWYLWNSDRQKYGEHILTLARMNKHHFRVFGSTLSSLENWPDQVRHESK